MESEKQTGLRSGTGPLPLGPLQSQQWWVHSFSHRITRTSFAFFFHFQVDLCGDIGTTGITQVTSLLPGQLVSDLPSVLHLIPLCLVVTWSRVLEIRQCASLGSRYPAPRYHTQPFEGKSVGKELSCNLQSFSSCRPQGIKTWLHALQSQKLHPVQESWYTFSLSFFFFFFYWEFLVLFSQAQLWFKSILIMLTWSF